MNMLLDLKVGTLTILPILEAKPSSESQRGVIRTWILPP